MAAMRTSQRGAIIKHEQHNITIKQEPGYSSEAASSTISDDLVGIKQETEYSTSTDNTSDDLVKIKQEEDENLTSKLLASLPEARRSKRYHKTKARRSSKTTHTQLTLNIKERTEKSNKNGTYIHLIRRTKIVHLSHQGEYIRRVNFNTEQWTLNESWKQEAQLRWNSTSSLSP